MDSKSLGLMVEHFNRKKKKWYDQQQLNNEEEKWYK